MTDSLGIGGLAGLFAIVAFGAIVPIVPTGAAVSAAALLARSSHPWEIVLVVACGAAGAYVGDVVVYAALRAIGEPLAVRMRWLHADDPEGAVQQLREELEAHELRTLLTSRLVPGGRVPVLLAAALGGYPLVRFVSAAVAAATLWSVVYAAIGVVGNWLFPGKDRLALIIVIVVALLAGLVVPTIKRLRRPPVSESGSESR